MSSVSAGLLRAFTPPDQARRLRALMEQQAHPADTPTGCRTIAVTSGKGGVGKSHLALNLAIAFAQSGRRVCLVDGNLGLGNLDLLCGLSGYWNLSHVVSGARRLDDILLQGPAGIHLIPGASGLADLADCPASVQRQLLLEFQHLERDHDLLLIDTGTGIHQLVRQFTRAADDVLVVTTPEPTAIADAYATIKSLGAPLVGESGSTWHVVVNQAESADQALLILDRLQNTARTFLRRQVHGTGWLPHDPAVPAAVRSRRPFLEQFPGSPAARAVLTLARRLDSAAPATRTAPGFFGRLRMLWERAAA